MSKLFHFGSLLFLLGLFSCKAVEDGFGLDNPDQYSRVYIAAAYNGAVNREMSYVRNDTVKVFANYSGVRLYPSDIQVELGIDNSLVEAFNQKDETGYKPLDAKCFSFEGAALTIPSGQTVSSSGASLVFLADAFVDDAVYLVPVSIASVSPALTVNENMRTVYFLVKCEGGKVEIRVHSLPDYALDEIEKW